MFACWSVLCLLSLLNPTYPSEDVQKKNQYKLKTTFKKSLRSQPEEIKAAVFFAPNLKTIISDFFTLDNIDTFLEIRCLNTFELLQSLESHLRNATFMTRLDIEKVKCLLTAVLSEVEIDPPKDAERMGNGITSCCSIFSKCFKLHTYHEELDLFSCVLNLLYAFTKGIISEQDLEQSVSTVFEKAVKGLITGIVDKLTKSRKSFCYKSKLMDLFFKLPLEVDSLKKFLNSQVIKAMERFVEEEKRMSSLDFKKFLQAVCSFDEETMSTQMVEFYQKSISDLIENSQNVVGAFDFSTSLEMLSTHFGFFDLLTMLAITVNVSLKEKDHEVMIKAFLKSGGMKYLWDLCFKEFSSITRPSDILQKLLAWIPAFAVIQIFLSESMSPKTNSNPGKEYLTRAIGHFRDFEEQLRSGEITRKALEIITRKKEEFCRISRILVTETGKPCSDDNGIESIINLRVKEWEQFLFWRTKASILIDMCEKPRDLEVNLVELKDALARNTESIPLSNLYSSESGSMTVTYFRLPSNVLNTIGQLCLAARSCLFTQTWIDFGQDKGVIQLEDVADSLFWPVVEKLTKTVKSLFAQSITLSKLAALLKDFKKSEAEEIVRELETLSVVLLGKDGTQIKYTKEEIEELANKVVQFFKLTISLDKAEKIVKLGEAFDLKGSFDVFKDVDEKIFFNARETQLKSLNQTHFSAANAVQRVTNKMEQCIDCLLQCMNLFVWLREKLEGIRDVKTFVELLSISAGEADYEADRVSCLHTVCLELEPIIFQLDAKWGPCELIECLESIVEKTENDTKLLEKLMDSNRCLEWFKREHESYGSVAMSCTIEAEAANHQGYYLIGYSEESFDIQTTVVTLENSLKLCVPQGTRNDGFGKESSKECLKEYNLDEIGDLQSKLVLIGGKAKDREQGHNQKDYFLQVFESATRVASLYVELCNSGCYPYVSWHVKFYCSSDTESSSGPVFSQMEKTCEKLEADLKEWKLTLHQKRWEYPPLNCFTVRQLMFLQKELNEVLTKEDIAMLRKLPAQVYTLLEEIHPGLNQEIFTSILHKSSHERRFGKRKTEDKEWQQVFRYEDKFAGIRLDVLKSFIEEIEEEVEDEDAAKAAVFECGTTDIVAAKVWVYDHIDERGIIEEWASRMSTILEKKNAQSDQCFSEISEEGVNNQNADLPSNQEDNDFLEMDELGKFLMALAESKRKKIKKLQVIEMINGSRPCLMVLPKDDLLCVIIDIYKQAGGRLPLAMEVEICNRQTTLEKVELLFRRALLDPDSIYIMAFIDQLDYNVSEQAFRKLNELLQQRSTRGTENGNYNLLLMCASEKEDGSYLASMWDEYRIVACPCPRAEEIKSFLITQLARVPSPSVAKSEHAAFADHESSSVRVVKSFTAGTGKSFFVKKIGERLKRNLENSDAALKQISRSVCTDLVVTTSLQGSKIDHDHVVRQLLPFDKKKNDAFPRIYHFDIASTVQNLDRFVFELLILGSLSTTTGNVWNKKPTDLYVLEVTESAIQMDDSISTSAKMKRTNIGTVMPLLPTTLCLTPKATLESLKEDKVIEPGFDPEEFKSCSYQRVYQNLKLFTSRKALLEHFIYKQGGDSGNLLDCLENLLSCCTDNDPSWRQISHFVHFFNCQLSDCEESIYCNPRFVGDTLPGFKVFVIEFMLIMSKEFATSSVNAVSPTSQGSLLTLKGWSESEHPYIFFNQDRESFSFLGFFVDTFGDLIDQVHSNVIRSRLIPKKLLEGFRLYGVDIFSRFGNWTREKKLSILGTVMGVTVKQDPDPTYVLTMDNVMKIMAINMRFRSGIPVIIMGETGCGKTRLIRFMCKLKAGQSGLQNMVLVKVHGGVTEDDIKSQVDKAMKLAQSNRAKHKNLETVLFFDEANTTSAIGLIKEIMCDSRMGGSPLNMESCGLKVIAACNPYRKHTDDMISRLESAGLGYKVIAKDAIEKLGKIPLRQLVYRVHQLPESLLPLVWDFGALSTEAENLYTSQIVNHYAQMGYIPDNSVFFGIVVETLSASQLYMREQKNECSFVSLRDVERAVQVLAWFHSKMPSFLRRIEGTRKKLFSHDEGDDDDVENLENNSEGEKESKEEMMRMSLSLALTVCYAARLERRQQYYKMVASCFTGPYKLTNGFRDLRDDAFCCQQMFLDELQLGENIAKNTALSENIFMMVVCIELRIPLFVVGKPGSSKSLAKTIVQDNMQGKLSHSDLFKTFKQILMCSYQCSPLSTASGIIATFRQCSRFQESKDLDTFVSVAVLDEIGLAEDSPRMPLKALHPLLEDGTDGSEDLTNEGTDPKAKRVAFIGISNWALDPAKMNRGLMLTRGEPNEKELVITAEGICSSDPLIKQTISGLFSPFAKAYLKIYKEQTRCQKLQQSKKEEFFGLRDYYCLIKMIFVNAKAARRLPTEIEIEHAVKRNFGGLEDFDTWEYFRQELRGSQNQERQDLDTEKVDISQVGLLRSYLQTDGRRKDTRYLLLMTENYAALRVLEKVFPEEYVGASVIFGSSFPKDQEFTQICRSINKIKVCMETGMTVILLNMENLYESLYDALNQYYVYLGGQRYVDLGLGSHRVKCRVHEDFKLIVVAEKSTVYSYFPIPLINRLEKHFLVISTCLTDDQRQLCETISQWATDFSVFKHERKQYSLGDAFVGYNNDTSASVVLETMHGCGEASSKEQILIEGKKKLLAVATPEAVARLRRAQLGHEAEYLEQVYFKEQSHRSLCTFLKELLFESRAVELSAQVTTFSRLLSPRDQTVLEKEFEEEFDLKFISLSKFQTEQQFSGEIRRYVNEEAPKQKLLIVQCNDGDENSNLIASARHLCHQSRKLNSGDLGMPFHIVFIINLRRVASGCQNLGSFHGVNWRSVHIDELRPPNDDMPSLVPFAGETMSFIFRPREPEDRDDSGDHLSEDDTMEEEYDSEKIFSLQLGLLRRCIQASCIQANDDAYNSSRITKRIHILTEMLSRNSSLIDPVDTCNFARVLLKIVYKVLSYKESSAIEQKDWFFDEAVAGCNLQECGTFRRALSYRIEKAILPVLSYIINHIDKNGNLDLLKEEGKQGLWLQLFCNEEFLCLDYSAMVMKQPNPDITSTGPLDVVVWFPFSLAVRGKINSFIQEHQAHCQDSGEHARNALQLTSFGLPLLRLLPQFLQAYLRDLIYFEFENINPQQHEVVAASVTARARNWKSKEMKEADIVDYHLVLRDPIFRQRLHCLFLLSKRREIEPAWIAEWNDSDEGDLIADVILLSKIIEELCPDVESLLDQRQRFSWCRDVEALKLPAQQLFDLYDSGQENFLPEAQEILKKARISWSRVQLIELFVEHVCPPGRASQKKYVQAALELWEALKEVEDDMSSVESWKVLGDMLQFLNGREEFLFDSELNEAPECIICTKPLDDCVQFPCFHVTCVECAHRWLTEDKKKSCLVCQSKISAEFKIELERQKRENVQELATFSQRCVAFFMEVVSQFCFFSQSALKNREIIHFMTTLVTAQSHKTKELSPFPDFGIDQTPTVRSFLIQQLMKASEISSTVEDYLQQHFENEAKHLNEDDIPSRIEMCLLLIHCYEDFKLAKLSKIPSEETLVEHLCSNLERMVSICEGFLSISNLKSLHNIADMRAVISKAVDIAYRHLVENSYETDFKQKLPRLYSLVKNICTMSNHENVKIFFMRYLVRRYGITILRKFLAVKDFMWLDSPDEEECKNGSVNPFLLYGEEYKLIRDCMEDAMIEKSVKSSKLSSVVSKESSSSPDILKEAYILFSVYSEVTISYSREEPEKEFLEQLSTYLKSEGFIQSQSVAELLMANQQGNGFEKLKHSASMDYLEHQISELVVHFWVVLSLKSRESPILQPLALIAVNPRDMTNAFLPTMPKDNLSEVIDAGEGLWKTYHCPNGHIYVITECTMPYERRDCPDCGALIGGLNHVAEAGNALHQRVDRTQTGHVLGFPSERFDFPVAERNLSTSSHSMVSVFLHAALLLGACNDLESVAALIHPSIGKDDPRLFMWEHLCKSVQVLAKAIGRSVDETLLFIHIVLEGMLKTSFSEEGDFGTFASKESRLEWEDKFDIRFIQPRLAALTALIEQGQGKLIDDSRLGSRNFIRSIYEKDAGEDETTIERDAFEYQRFWRFRVPITVTHLKFSLTEFVTSKGKSTCSILQKFLEKEDILRFVSALPDIVLLQKILSGSLSGRMDSTRAKKIPIKQVFMDFFKGRQRDDVNQLFRKYIRAWKGLLPSFLSNGLTKGFDLSKNSPIACILPSSDEMGKNALMLLNCLVDAHNSLVKEYRDVQEDISELQQVLVQDIKQFHLIAYDYERDLVPMMYAHCDYSLEIGKGTIIDYNFAALERQLVKTLLSGKPEIVLSLKQLKYADQINCLERFEELEKRVEQRQIPFAEQYQMAGEIQSLPEVCEALRATEIAIGLLSTTSGDSNVFFKNYLTEVLRLSPDACLPSVKIQSICRLAHIRSLWSMLTVEKAYRLYVCGEDPFDLIDMFREEVKGLDQQIVRHFDIGCLFSELTEYIVLEVPLREENSLNHPLKDCLEYFLDKKKKPNSNIKGINNLPDAVCLKHIYSFWKIIACERNVPKM